MEKDKTVLCRPFHCPECERLNRPIEEYAFVVFGHEHQCMFINKAKYHGVKYITPHLIFYDGVQTEDYVEILVCCGINTCGVKIHQTDDPQYHYDIEIKKVRKYQITHADYKALMEYKDETYKLD